MRSDNGDKISVGSRITDQGAFMRTVARSVAVCAFALAALLPMTAAAQSQVAAKDAAAVLGTWAATLDGPMGAIPLGIAMSDKDGVLAAKIDGGELSVGDINDIA